MSEEEFDKIKKTKRNKRKPDCPINRRNGCGICGSLNVALQGVVYCTICGEEKEYLLDGYFMQVGALSFSCNRENYPEVGCGCMVESIRFVRKGTSLNKFIKVSEMVHSKKEIREVGKCLDCGAVQSTFCPNNKGHHCWKSTFGGHKYCGCGYRV